GGRPGVRETGNGPRPRHRVDREALPRGRRTPRRGRHGREGGADVPRGRGGGEGSRHPADLPGGELLARLDRGRRGRGGPQARPDQGDGRRLVPREDRRRGVEEVRRYRRRREARPSPRHEDAVARGGPSVRLEERGRGARGARREGRIAEGWRRALPNGQREPPPRCALRADPGARETREPDLEHPRRRRPRTVLEDGPRRAGRVPDRRPDPRAYANVLSFLRFASIRSIFACSSRSMWARMSAHGTLSRYEWTGRPLPSFLMSLLSTHFR